MHLIRGQRTSSVVENMVVLIQGTAQDFFPSAQQEMGGRSQEKIGLSKTHLIILHSTTLSNTEMSLPRRFKKDIAACATALTYLQIQTLLTPLPPYPRTR